MFWNTIIAPVWGFLADHPTLPILGALSMVAASYLLYLRTQR